MKLKLAILTAGVFAGLSGGAFAGTYPDVGNSWPLEPEALTLKGAPLIQMMQEGDAWKERNRAKQASRAEKALTRDAQPVDERLWRSWGNR